MTTSIGFPGQDTSVAIKTLHAAILATGIFQITYLLACFSIMAGAVVGDSATKTITIARALAEKLEHQPRLADTESTAITPTSVSPLTNPDAPT